MRVANRVPLAAGNIVSMIEFNGELLVATQQRIYKLNRLNDLFEAQHFELLGEDATQYDLGGERTGVPHE